MDPVRAGGPGPAGGLPVSGDLEVADPLEAIEACHEAGWTDGLPVVPPTEALVERFLAVNGWAGDEVLFVEDVRRLTVPSRQVVANAVMAGCLPEHLPVVAAALRAMNHPDFRAHIPFASTGGAAPVLVVNGPVRHELGFNGAGNLFGPGNRANAAVGRAVRLVLRNCLGAIPGVLDLSTQGSALKYSACFAEREEASPWAPLHVRRGFDADTSTVTVLGCESPHHVLTRSDVGAEAILVAAGDVLASLGSHSDGMSLLVISPEHAGILAGGGWDVPALQERLFQASRRTLADLRVSGRAPGDVEPGDDQRTRPRGRVPGDVLVAVGGGDAGCSSAWFPGFSRGRATLAVTAALDPALPVVGSSPGPGDSPGLGDGVPPAPSARRRPEEAR